MNIHLLTFGYRIGKNLGVAASWYGIANPFTQSGTDGMWGMGAIMAGPLCSFRLNDNTSLEFRGLFGFVLETKQYDSNEISYARGPGTSVGAILRYNIAPRWSLLLNLDTFNTKLDIQPEQDPRISVLNSSVGIAYRLK